MHGKRTDGLYCIQALLISTSFLLVALNTELAECTSSIPGLSSPSSAGEISNSTLTQSLTSGEFTITPSSSSESVLSTLNNSVSTVQSPTSRPNATTQSVVPISSTITPNSSTESTTFTSNDTFSGVHGTRFTATLLSTSRETTPSPNASTQNIEPISSTVTPNSSTESTMFTSNDTFSDVHGTRFTATLLSTSRETTPSPNATTQSIEPISSTISPDTSSESSVTTTNTTSTRSQSTSLTTTLPSTSGESNPSLNAATQSTVPISSTITSNSSSESGVPTSNTTFTGVQRTSLTTTLPSTSGELAPSPNSSIVSTSSTITSSSSSESAVNASSTTFSGVQGQSTSPTRTLVSNSTETTPSPNSTAKSIAPISSTVSPNTSLESAVSTSSTTFTGVQSPSLTRKLLSTSGESTPSLNTTTQRIVPILSTISANSLSESVVFTSNTTFIGVQSASPTRTLLSTSRESTPSLNATIQSIASISPTITPNSSSESRVPTSNTTFTGVQRTSLTTTLPSTSGELAPSPNSSIVPTSSTITSSSSSESAVNASSTTFSGVQGQSTSPTRTLVSNSTETTPSPNSTAKSMAPISSTVSPNTSLESAVSTSSTTFTGVQSPSLTRKLLSTSGESTITPNNSSESRVLTFNTTFTGVQKTSLTTTTLSTSRESTPSLNATIQSIASISPTITCNSSSESRVLSSIATFTGVQKTSLTTTTLSTSRESTLTPSATIQSIVLISSTITLNSSAENPMFTSNTIFTSVQSTSLATTLLSTSKETTPSLNATTQSTVPTSSTITLSTSSERRVSTSNTTVTGVQSTSLTTTSVFSGVQRASLTPTSTLTSSESNFTLEAIPKTSVTTSNYGVTLIPSTQFVSVTLTSTESIVTTNTILESTSSAPFRNITPSYVLASFPTTGNLTSGLTSLPASSILGSATLISTESNVTLKTISESTGTSSVSFSTIKPSNVLRSFSSTSMATSELCSSSSHLDSIILTSTELNVTSKTLLKSTSPASFSVITPSCEIPSLSTILTSELSSPQTVSSHLDSVSLTSIKPNSSLKAILGSTSSLSLSTFTPSYEIPPLSTILTSELSSPQTASSHLDSVSLISIEPNSTSKAILMSTSSAALSAITPSYEIPSSTILTSKLSSPQTASSHLDSVSRISIEPNSTSKAILMSTSSAALSAITPSYEIPSLSTILTSKLSSPQTASSHLDSVSLISIEPNSTSKAILMSTSSLSLSTFTPSYEIPSLSTILTSKLSSPQTASNHLDSVSLISIEPNSTSKAILMSTSSAALSAITPSYEIPSLSTILTSKLSSPQTASSHLDSESLISIEPNSTSKSILGNTSAGSSTSIAPSYVLPTLSPTLTSQPSSLYSATTSVTHLESTTLSSAETFVASKTVLNSTVSVDHSVNKSISPSPTLVSSSEMLQVASENVSTSLVPFSYAVTPSYISSSLVTTSIPETSSLYSVDEILSPSPTLALSSNKLDTSLEITSTSLLSVSYSAFVSLISLSLITTVTLETSSSYSVDERESPLSKLASSSTKLVVSCETVPTSSASVSYAITPSYISSLLLTTLILEKSSSSYSDGASISHSSRQTSSSGELEITSEVISKSRTPSSSFNPFTTSFLLPSFSSSLRLEVSSMYSITESLSMLPIHTRSSVTSHFKSGTASLFTRYVRSSLIPETTAKMIETSSVDTSEIGETVSSCQTCTEITSVVNLSTTTTELVIPSTTISVLEEYKIQVLLLVPKSVSLDDEFKRKLERRLENLHILGSQSTSSRRRRAFDRFEFQRSASNPVENPETVKHNDVFTDLYKVRNRRKAANETRVQIISMTRAHRSEDVVVVFYISVNGKPLQGSSAAKTLNSRTNAEIVAELGYQVAGKFTAVNSETKTTPNKKKNETLFIILSITIPAAFVVLSCIFIKCMKKQKKSPRIKLNKVSVQHPGPSKAEEKKIGERRSAFEERYTAPPTLPAKDYPDVVVQRPKGKQRSKKKPTATSALDIHEKKFTAIPASAFENITRISYEGSSNMTTIDQIPLRFRADIRREVEAPPKTTSLQDIVDQSGVPSEWMVKKQQVDKHSRVDEMESTEVAQEHRTIDGEMRDEAKGNEEADSDDTMQIKANIEKWRNKMRQKQKMREKREKRKRFEQDKLIALEQRKLSRHEWLIAQPEIQAILAGDDLPVTPSSSKKKYRQKLWHKNNHPSDSETGSEIMVIPVRHRKRRRRWPRRSKQVFPAEEDGVRLVRVRPRKERVHAFEEPAQNESVVRGRYVSSQPDERTSPPQLIPEEYELTENEDHFLEDAYEDEYLDPFVPEYGDSRRYQQPLRPARFVGAAAQPTSAYNLPFEMQETSLSRAPYILRPTSSENIGTRAPGRMYYDERYQRPSHLYSSTSKTSPLAKKNVQVYSELPSHKSERHDKASSPKGVRVTEEYSPTTNIVLNTTAALSPGNDVETVVFKPSDTRTTEIEMRNYAVSEEEAKRLVARVLQRASQNNVQPR